MKKLLKLFKPKYMKQLLICLSFVCFFASTSFAQISDQDIQQEIEKLQNEMRIAMQDMEVFFGTMPKSLDSLDLQQFGLGDINKADVQELMDNLLPKGSNIDLDEMIQQFEKEIQGIDMKQFEELFDQLGLDQPAIPAPDRLKDDNDKKSSEKKEERKKYSM